MSDRPSDGMRFDELRDEFDWMFEFQSRMAEHIRNDPDVHSLADYVSKLEEQNAKLRELVCHLYYVKPRDVTSILVNGKVLNFDELMAEVGLRWEDA